MADSVARVVRKEIDRLKKEIGRRESELASLRSDLGKHEKAYSVLGGEATAAHNSPARPSTRRPAKKRPGRARKGAAVNWNSVLEKLPGRFSMEDLRGREEAKGKSPGYIRQIASAWLRERKTSSIGRGRYRKLGGRKSSAAT